MIKQTAICKWGFHPTTLKMKQYAESASLNQFIIISDEHIERGYLLIDVPLATIMSWFFGSLETTNKAFLHPPSRMRWPTVHWWTPECCATTLPSSIWRKLPTGWIWIENPIGCWTIASVMDIQYKQSVAILVRLVDWETAGKKSNWSRINLASVHPPSIHNHGRLTQTSGDCQPDLASEQCSRLWMTWIVSNR